jgi:hypothetical protein
MELIYLYNNAQTSEHSSNIDDVNRYYIINKKKDVTCINNWPFIVDNEDLIISSRTIINLNCSENLDFNLIDKVFLLKCEIHNAGHLICNIFYQLYYYFKNELTCKILIPTYIKKNYFIMKLLEYFIDLNKIIFIDSEIRYKFNDIIYINCSYIYTWFCSGIYDINKDSQNIKLLTIKPIINDNYTENIKYFIDIITQKNISNNINFQKKDKIFLIKTIDKIGINTINANKNHSIERSFNNDYNIFFENNNFFKLNHDDYTIDEFYFLLNNCKTLVLSWGCISYLNKMFIINEKINIILLAHKGYYFEYNNLKKLGDFVPKCENLQVILNLNSYMDDETKNIFDIALSNI